jgi:hypothetical protein
MVITIHRLNTGSFSFSVVLYMYNNFLNIEVKITAGLREMEIGTHTQSWLHFLCWDALVILLIVSHLVWTSFWIDSHEKDLLIDYLDFKQKKEWLFHCTRIDGDGDGWDSKQKWENKSIMRIDNNQWATSAEKTVIRAWLSHSDHAQHDHKS